MATFSITITPEAQERLREIAARERRRVWAQASYMLERLLLGDASEDELRALLGRRGTLPATTPKKDGKP